MVGHECPTKLFYLDNKDYLNTKNEDEFLKLPKFYQQKRDYFNTLMADIGFEINPTSGTYFQVLNFNNLTDETDEELAMRLVRNFGIAAIPMSSFYHNEENTKSLRFCFAKSDAVLDAAAEKLRNFYSSAKKQLGLF